MELDPHLERGLTVAVVLSCVLAVIVGVALLIDLDTVQPDEDDWYILVRGKVVSGGRYHLEDLMELGKDELRTPLVGTGEDGKPHTYAGILLRNLLSDAGMEDGAGKVTVRAVDALSRSFSVGSLEGSTALLAYEKDGAPLQTRSRGGDGPIRLILEQDEVGSYNAQYCVKWVSEVIVE